MSRRRIARSLAVAALASVAMSLAALPAHANEFPQVPSATATPACKNVPGDYIAAWKVHLANDPISYTSIHFVVTIDAYKPYEYDLQPGDTFDELYGVPNAIPTHITITADGTTLVDTSMTQRCEEPTAKITFTCQEGGVATLTYDLKNPLPIVVTFVVHMTGGSTWSDDLSIEYPYEEYSTIAEHPAEDAAYDVSVEAEGKVLATKTGVADCKPPETTTTTTTVPAPTTTTVPNAPTTSTTVAAVAVKAPPTPPAATAAAPTLPFTGSSSAPLAATGLVLVGAGGGTLLALRRRTAKA
jgi:hypothetical protein